MVVCMDYWVMGSNGLWIMGYICAMCYGLWAMGYGHGVCQLVYVGGVGGVSG